MRKTFKRLAVLLALLASACEQERPMSGGDGTERIGFSPLVIDETKPRTKASDDIIGPDGHTYKVMEQKWNNSSYCGDGIIIHQYKKRASEAGFTSASSYFYEVPAGKEGILEMRDPLEGGRKNLYWDGTDTKHVFHGWTRHREKYGFHLVDETYAVVDYEVRNERLENLVAFHTQALDYGTNGQTVELWFKRMLIRMVINNVTHIDRYGAVNKDGVYNVVSIEFPNLQATAKFVTGVGSAPNPDGTGIEEPHVEDWPVGDPNYRLGPSIGQVHNVYDWGEHLIYHMSPFAFAEETSPGVFESTGKGFFRLVYDLGGGEYGFYEGDLASFAPRLTEVKAGEVIEIDFEISDSDLNGMNIWIEPWNTDVPSIVGVPARQGIYSHEDFLALRKLLDENVKGKTLTVEEIDSIMDGYFSIDEDGKRVIRLYNNIYMPDFDFDSLWLPRDYVFDGMGHRVDYLVVRPSGSNKGTIRDITMVSGGVTTIYDQEGSSTTL